MLLRRRIAWGVTAVLAVLLTLWGISFSRSVGYRRGSWVLEMREGVVGYYNNWRFRDFAWLDRGRDQGFMVTGHAQVPQGPYRLYATNQYWVAVYFKLWHLCTATGLVASFFWWRARGRDIPGRCFNCGYALQGLGRDGDVVSCPECGAVDDGGRGDE